MKKRWMAALLAIVLTFSMLTGCDGNKVTSDIGSASPQATDTIASDTPQLSDGTEETPQSGNEQTGKVDAPGSSAPTEPEQITSSTTNTAFSISEVPTYSGAAYVAVNGNVPYFTTEELTTNSFESYSSLDYLGRCTMVYACVGQDIMPTEERGSIGQVKPTGWHTVKYDCVDGKYLYNRCHLIGYQLTGENANEKNLITGTRYLNMDGMLPFENMVADYVQETNNHVLYRVTPIFEGENLLADGVLMEGYSVEDDGDDICFCVFAYNVQPGVTINYATGDSALDGTASTSEPMTSTVVQEPSSDNQDGTSTAEAHYVLNNNTKKFHLPSCSSADDIKDSNREDYYGSREDLIERGYDPCKRCNP